eukprot:gene12094-10434_t
MDLTWDSILISSLDLLNAETENQEADPPPFVLQPSDADTQPDTDYANNYACPCPPGPCHPGYCQAGSETKCTVSPDGYACQSKSVVAGICQAGACVAPDFSQPQCIPPPGPSMMPTNEIVQSKSMVLETTDTETDADPADFLEEANRTLRFFGYFIACV